MLFLFPYRSFRFCGYPQFVNWTWGYLGQKVQKVILACVVMAIRARYPDPHNNYTGFLTVAESELVEFYQDEDASSQENMVGSPFE